MESTLIHLCNGLIKEEYFSLLGTLARFDDRILLVSLWSATLVIAVIGVAFFIRSRGLLLLALFGTLGFWTLQGTMAVQQASYEPRMRQIEGTCFETARGPAINWGSQAGLGLAGAPDRSIADLPFSAQITRPQSLAAAYLPLPPVAGAMFEDRIALPHTALVLIALLGLLFMRKRIVPAQPAPVVNVSVPSAPPSAEPAAPSTSPKPKPQAA